MKQSRTEQPKNAPPHAAGAPTEVPGAAKAQTQVWLWGGALLAVTIVLVAALWLLLREGASPQTALNATQMAVAPTAADLREVPDARFTDVTAAAGIEFVHVNGAYGDKLLPETMGGGVAFFDYDGDGDQDLLLINSGIWPWRKEPGQPLPTPALYRNDGTGKFTDVTAGSGLDIHLYGMGVAVGDYDNDGFVDVLITAVGENRLFHNRGGGSFVDVTAASGISSAALDWNTSAAWVDIDNDGDLDLFVCKYVQWSREIDFQANYQLAGIGRAYGQPMNFPGSFPYLFRNEGGGRFSDITESAGLRIRVPMAKSLGVAPVDLNADGWMDLVVANDTVQNFVLSNQHNGTFREIGAVAGIAFDNFGQTRGAMGIDAARFRNDSALGIAIGNFANEMNALYVSRPDQLLFADEAIAEGMGHASQSLLKFGLFFFDYDLDGRLDMLTANGHLENEINKIQRTQQYRQPAQLFWNRGEGRGARFVPVTAQKCGSDLFQPIVGRGSAYADIDGDGDLDAILTQIGGKPLLVRNDQRLNHHWVRLKLVGNRCNKDAIGAWVELRLGNQVLSRQVMPTKGYLSQSELPITIGLGTQSRIDRAEVLWPDGRRQSIPSLRLNGLNVIAQAP